MKHWQWLLAAGALVLSAHSAQAAECKGTDVTHPDSVSVNGKTLVLNGMGIREATMLNVNVYVAALYLPTKTQSDSAAASNDSEKQLVLHFVREVGKSDVTNAWSEGFKRNGGLPAFQTQLTQLNGWMQDMKPGEKMSFTYVPGKGLEVKVKGASKGTIEGKDFMQVFFKIWLGSPPNAGLKDGLLGKIPCED